jgi:hypothetical protein
MRAGLDMLLLLLLTQYANLPKRWRVKKNATIRLALMMTTEQRATEASTWWFINTVNQQPRDRCV